MSIINLFDQKFARKQSSYMMVTVLALLDSLYGEGNAPINEKNAPINKVAERFKEFYLERLRKGRKPEKDGTTLSKIETLPGRKVLETMLRMPLVYLKDAIHVDKNEKCILFKPAIASELNRKTVKELRKVAWKHLYNYYNKFDPMELTEQDLESLPVGYAVTADDVARLSGYDRIKGIHPLENNGVIILCTLNGPSYANTWLDEEETVLKYHLEGRTQSNGSRIFNENLKTNQTVAQSKEDGYPVYVFTRYNPKELFHFEGKFICDRVEVEANGDKYFVLQALNKDVSHPSKLPNVSREKIIEAMRYFDRELRDSPEFQGWENKGYQKYAVLYEGKQYPPKDIVSLATGVPKTEFHGGTQANAYLEKRGFKTIELSKESIQMDAAQLVEHIYNYITAQGFIFSRELIKNLYLSLKTKPFVILAGISGTGKSKIVRLLAEALGATAENGRYSLIAVRPDWNDSSDLLGYRNLQGEFISGPLTRVIEAALANPQYPYFVCLDEMNLARVEYYFSDFLSIIESRKLKNGIITSLPLPLQTNQEEQPGFPENLYIIGTVNMDETTHAFSRKVLDRANTIELTEVNLNVLPQIGEGVEPVEVPNDFFRSDYVQLIDCLPGNESFLQEQIKILEQVNDIISTCGFQVGYRVRDEFCFYLLYNRQMGLLPEDTAVDFQIMQKVLPRLQGSDHELENVLHRLMGFCKGRYPLSLNKLKFMLRRLEGNGFTSFWP